MKTIIAIMLISFALSAEAQDKIFFTNGDTLSGKMTGQNSEFLYLTNSQSKYKVPVDSVASFVYNGKLYGNGVNKTGSMMAGNNVDLYGTFEWQLEKAGTTLLATTVIAILVGAASTLIDEAETAQILAFAGGAIFSIGLIVTAGKLQKAARMHQAH